MAFSVTNVSSELLPQSVNPLQRIQPYGRGGQKITYDVTNSDGSIDRVARLQEWRLMVAALYDKNPTSLANRCEQVDRGQIPMHYTYYANIVSKQRIKASDLEILVNTQQQVINSQQQTITNLNAQIQSILQNIQALKAANADLRSQQGSLQQQIDRLRAEVTAQEATIATIPALKLQVESQKIQIATLTSLVQLIFQ